MCVLCLTAFFARTLVYKLLLTSTGLIFRYLRLEFARVILHLDKMVASALYILDLKGKVT